VRELDGGFLATWVEVHGEQPVRDQTLEHLGQGDRVDAGAQQSAQRDSPAQGGLARSDPNQ